jgi:hypothetical protein
MMLRIVFNDTISGILHRGVIRGFDAVVNMLIIFSKQFSNEAFHNQKWEIAWKFTEFRDIFLFMKKHLIGWIPLFPATGPTDFYLNSHGLSQRDNNIKFVSRNRLDG